MNLYKEQFEHWSQKDSARGFKRYFLANDDRDAYAKVYGDSDCLTVDRFSYEEYEVGEPYEIDYEEYDPEELTVEKIREIVASKRGELNFNDLDSLNCWQDLYYGMTLKGWELVKENISAGEASILVTLGIIQRKEK